MLNPDRPSELEFSKLAPQTTALKNKFNTNLNQHGRIEELLGKSSSSAEALVLSQEIIEKAHDHKKIIGNRGSARNSNLLIPLGSQKKRPIFKIIIDDEMAVKA